MTPAQHARAILLGAPSAITGIPDSQYSGQAPDFLKTVFQGQDHGFAVLFAIPGNTSMFYDLSESDWAQQAEAGAMQIRANRNVYIGVGTQRKRLDHTERGKADAVITVPGLWADIDVRGPNHAANHYPPSYQDAHSLLECVPFRPTLTVHSGGGLQPYWLFREPFEIKTDKDRAQITTLAAAFLAHISAAAGTRGWKIDQVSDLARILRLPGTFNHKSQPAAPVYYQITEGEPRYNPSEIEEFLALESDPVSRSHTEGAAPDKPRAELPKIMAGCAWMRRCKDAAIELTEPEWYRMLSVVSRCKNGRAQAHDLSRPHAGYKAFETDSKFDQAFTAAGPATCTYVEANLGSMHCGSCRNKGKIKSPVVLGLPRKKLKPATAPVEPEEEAVADTFDECEAAVEAAIQTNDIALIYKTTGMFALLNHSDLQVIQCKIARHFKKDFRVADFKRAMKEKKIELRRADHKTHTLTPISVNTQWIRNTTDQAMPALWRYNEPPKLFTRAGQMVHIAIDEDERPTIYPVTEHYLRGCLDRCANFIRSTETGDNPVPVPMEVVRDILSLDSRTWRMPNLRSVVEVPSLRPDGTLIDAHGYDRQSGMYYAPAAGLVTFPVPADPTADDIDAALAMLDEAIGEFPYADASSKANALGLLLTPIVRPAISGCTPLALIDAPKAGTGKSLFVDAVSMIISGRPAPMTPCPRNEEEMGKQIGSSLMAGRPIICFDNLEGILQSPALALALTAKEFEARILGESRNMSLPNNATWIVTGNNIRPCGDMPRRCYQIRLDSKTSNPAMGRKFKHPNLLDWIASNRAKLLHSLLVIARGWYSIGAPEAVKNALGSFESWHRTVGGILAYARVEGFMQKADEFIKYVDETANQWESFLLAIREQIQVSFTVSDLIHKMEYSERLQEAMPDRLKEAAGKRGDLLGAAIGNAFAKRRDQRFGDAGVYLTRGDLARTRVATWKILLSEVES